MLFARTVVITVLFAGVPASVALAQTVADFYRGKSIELDINTSVGGGYDLYARMVARHMGKHIPGNPTILPKNMEGGGGMRLANWLYNVASKDGTVLGALARATAFEPLLGNKSASMTEPNSIISAALTMRSAFASLGTRPASRRSRMRGRCSSSSDPPALPTTPTSIPRFSPHFRCQVQDDPWLSGRERNQPRDGAWRSAKPLQYPLVDR